MRLHRRVTIRDCQKKRSTKTTEEWRQFQKWLSVGCWVLVIVAGQFALARRNTALRIRQNNTHLLHMVLALQWRAPYRRRERREEEEGKCTRVTEVERSLCHSQLGKPVSITYFGYRHWQRHKASQLVVEDVVSGAAVSITFSNFNTSFIWKAWFLLLNIKGKPEAKRSLQIFLNWSPLLVWSVHFFFRHTQHFTQVQCPAKSFHSGFYSFYARHVQTLG